jgi:polyribonucleotide nucleotidyltransferase
MSTDIIYLVDTNILVEAYKRYYSFDIVPSFWNILIQKAKAGRVVSIDRVKDEIDGYGEEDELKVWINREFGEWFIPTDDANIITAYREIIKWSTDHAQFTDAAKAEFASVADSWLIACAKAHNYVLVTHEAFSAGVKKRVLIPNACLAHNITHINTFDMMRQLNVRLE